MGPLSHAWAVFLSAAFLAQGAAAHSGHGTHRHAQQAGQPGSPYAVDQGRCIGWSDAAFSDAPAGAPYRLKTDDAAHDLELWWRALGYQLDRSASAIRHGGRVLTQGEYDALMLPFDASRERVKSDVWTGLMTYGHRLDEATCRVTRVDEPGHLTRLEIRAMTLQFEHGTRHLAYEEMLGTLRRLPADRPVPPELVARLRESAKAGLVLPPHIQGLLDAGAVTGRLIAALEPAYAESQRYWDGSTPLRDFAAMAGVPGVTTSWRPKVFVHSVEERLSREIGRDLGALFGEHEGGRLMLRRLAGRDGRPDIPAVRFLKLGQRPDEGFAEAVQDPANGTVVVNHWTAAAAAVELLAPREREAARREFADPYQFSQRLLRDPHLRRGLLKHLEIVLVHEFIHTWQNRRSRYDDELSVGSIPGSNPIDKEQEAFREQFRYYHSRLLADPAYVRRPEMDSYISMLTDYDGFRESIRAQYMSGAAGTSDLRTIAAAQEERRSLAQRLRATSVSQWLTQSLRLRGIERGREVIQQARTDFALRDVEFREEELPRLRREGLRASFEALLPERAGRALQIAAAAQARAPLPPERIETARRRAEDVLLSPRASLDQKIGALYGIDASIRAGGRAWDARVLVDAQAAARDSARHRLDAAEKGPRPGDTVLSDTLGLARFSGDTSLIKRAEELARRPR